VVIFGWQDAGLLGQQLFAVGGMLCIGFDAEDLFTCFVLFLCPTTFKCLGEPVAAKGLVLSLFHHALSIGMFLPMLIVYPDARPFHYISCSLLLAAGIAYGFGCYKFTLDTSEPRGFRVYKVIVMVQFVVIWLTRCYVWFPACYSLLSLVYSDTANPDRMAFFIAGCVVICTMTLFNLVIISDCTIAAVKWLPKKVPTETKEKIELLNTIIQSGGAHNGQTFGNAEEVAADRGFIDRRVSLAVLHEVLSSEALGSKKGSGDVQLLSS